MRSYYWSASQGFRDLEHGHYDFWDCPAFTGYQSLDFNPELQEQFKNAWGYEIGRECGAISSLSTDLKQALERGNP